MVIRYKMLLSLPLLMISVAAFGSEDSNSLNCLPGGSSAEGPGRQNSGPVSASDGKPKLRQLGKTKLTQRTPSAAVPRQEVDVDTGFAGTYAVSWSRLLVCGWSYSEVEEMSRYNILCFNKPRALGFTCIRGPIKNLSSTKKGS